jgi:hypothetical protein
MTDLLDETIQELKDEKTLNLVKKYGKWLAVAAVLFITGTLTHTLYQNNKRDQVHAQGAEYLKGLLKNKPGMESLAMEHFRSISDEKASPFSPLAQLQLAGVFANSKDYESALNTYQAVVESNADKAIVDFANFMIINIKNISGEINTKETIAALESYLFEQPVFALLAEEMLTGAYLENADYKKALASSDNILLNAKAGENAKLRVYRLKNFAEAMLGKKPSRPK